MIKKTKKQLHTVPPRVAHPGWSSSDVCAGLSLIGSCIGLGVILALSLGASRSHPDQTSHLPTPQDLPVQALSSPNPKVPDTARVGSAPPRQGLVSPYSPLDTSQQLLRFSSTAERDVFLSLNGLSVGQISFIPQLNLYQVPLASPVLTPGSSLIENKPYTALLTPTDPGYSSQWYLPQINAPLAWNHQRGDPSVVTAVIDTGFALNHEDLRDQWRQNPLETGLTSSEGGAPNCSSRGLPLDKSCNNLDDDSNGFTDDSLGWNFTTGTRNVQAGQTSPSSSAASHGTLVSGLIGGATNNGRGISGGTWLGSLLPLQALDDTGNGTTLSVALSVRYAVDQGAQVINLSLGSQEPDTVLSEQIQYALSQGVSVVAAAGNDGCSCLLYPARYPGVLSVGAVTSQSLRASYSSYGPDLSLVAPGSSICSTDWSLVSNASYSCGHNGTSFASPLVASAVSLLRSQSSALSPADIRSALIASATKLAGMSGQARTNEYGSGLLNVYKSLETISAPAPQGSILNVHSVSLSAAGDSRQADAFNTTCTTAAPNVCHVRAIHGTTNEVVELDDVSPQSMLNLYWSAAAKHLTSGQWIIQIYAVNTTSQSLVREESVTISP